MQALNTTWCLFLLCLKSWRRMPHLLSLPLIVSWRPLNWDEPTRLSWPIAPSSGRLTFASPLYPKSANTFSRQPNFCFNFIRKIETSGIPAGKGPWNQQISPVQIPIPISYLTAAALNLWLNHFLFTSFTNGHGSWIL